MKVEEKKLTKRLRSAWSRISGWFRCLDIISFLQFAGCTLLELRYDANVENKYADETMRYWQEHQQELLILESSFRTDETVAGSGFSPNHTYKDWQWHLVRAQDGTGWEVVDWGY